MPVDVGCKLVCKNVEGQHYQRNDSEKTERIKYSIKLIYPVSDIMEVCHILKMRSLRALATSGSLPVSTISG
jgi:hypothetical protein